MVSVVHHRRMPRACTVVLNALRYTECHGLVAWMLTFLRHKFGWSIERKYPRYRPVALRLHWWRIVAKNVRHHGTSPWHPLSEKRETPRSECHGSPPLS